ncbi:MAG: integrase core domain-containing protein [Nitrospira sp.]|nr:integrase core domain-containing protein [Nitrospira sp.]
MKTLNRKMGTPFLNAWFLNLAHAQVSIEAWRREDNEEQPKKAWGRLTPAASTRQLANTSATVVPGV